MAATQTVKLDWSKAEGSGFQPLDTGDYNATLTSVIMNKAKAEPHNDKFEWEFVLTDAKMNNRKYWNHNVLLPDNMWSLFNILVGLGMTAEQIQKYSDPEQLLAYIKKNFVGKKVVLTIVKKKDNTNTLNKVELVDSIGEIEDDDEEGTGEGEEADNLFK